jgi:acyl carrier protein
MQVTALDIPAQIRTYIIHNLLFGDESLIYSDEDSFLEREIVDSLGVIELVTFLEAQFGISVADHELIPENFDSVKNLAEYVARKLEAATLAEAPRSSFDLEETYAGP